MRERAMDTQDRDEDARTTDEPHVALLHDHAAPEEDDHEHQGQPSPPGNIISSMLFWPVGKGLQKSLTHEHPLCLSITNTD